MSLRRLVPNERFWKWTLQKRASWKEDPTEAAIAVTVFGVTGTTSVMMVRPVLKNTIGLDGTFQDGPWSYRIGSIVLVSPIYAVMLIGLGTAAGRHTFFAGMGTKILGRFLPKSSGEALRKFIIQSPK
jgi:hypothetical protein